MIPLTPTFRRLASLRLPAYLRWALVLLCLNGFSAAQDAPAESQPGAIPTLTLYVGEAREVNFAAPVDNVAVVTPGLISVTLRGRTVIVSALALGESPVIVFTGGKREAIFVEVRSRPVQTDRERQFLTRATNNRARGSYTIAYTPAANGAPTQLRQSLFFQRKLENGRLLHAEGDVFNFLGGGDTTLTTPFEPRFGINRFGLGVVDPRGSLDVLDSDLALSRLNFNNYTLRGPHLSFTERSRWDGTEFFAGLAQPQINAFAARRGVIAGAVVPVLKRAGWRLRGGAIGLFPSAATNAFSSLQADARNALLLHTDLRYRGETSSGVEAAADWSHEGGFSGYAAGRLKRNNFLLTGEVLRVAADSPLFTLGARSSGARQILASAQWTPNRQWAVFASYQRNRYELLPFGARFGQTGNLRSRAAFISAGYTPTLRSRLTVSYVNQNSRSTLTLPDNALSRNFSNRQNNLTGNYSQTFGRWASETVLRLSRSRDTQFEVPLERGSYLREEVRYTWERNYLAGYVAFTNNTPSLDSLIIRSPQLLPSAVRREFAQSPARFLFLYRNRLNDLFGEEELGTLMRQKTAFREIGARAQSITNRFTLSGELRFNTGRIFGQEQRNILANASVTGRLDDANLLGLNVTRYQDQQDSNRSTTFLTGTYTYRFGGGSGKGFRLGSLLGLTRLLGFGNDTVTGRVFFDLNLNGQDDPGEPGHANVPVSLDDGAYKARTDTNGNFRIASVPAGEHTVTLQIETLGVRVRAITPSESRIVVGRRPVHILFGLTDEGFVAGRVFNDLGQPAEDNAKWPGLKGVRLTLRKLNDAGQPEGEPLPVVTDAAGFYELARLLPGIYLLDVDTASLPPNFRIPAETQLKVLVNPLRGAYQNIPVAAQRALSGIVFRDQNGNGQYDPGTDQTVAGARITAGAATVVSAANGAYLLRNLPAGRLEIRVQSDAGEPGEVRLVELNEDPTILRGVNLALRGVSLPPPKPEKPKRIIKIQPLRSVQLNQR